MACRVGAILLGAFTEGGSGMTLRAVCYDRQPRGLNGKPIWSCDFVARHQETDDRATNEADCCADDGLSASTNRLNTEGLRRRAWVECRCTYPGPHTGAHSSQKEGVAQTVRVFHEFHAANILPLDRLRSGCLLQ
jgi:hypothetical protein